MYQNIRNKSFLTFFFYKITFLRYYNKIVIRIAMGVYTVCLGSPSALIYEGDPLFIIAYLIDILQIHIHTYI